MNYELEPTDWTMRVYAGDAHAYRASVQFHICGDRAWASSMSSPKLLEVIRDNFEQIAETLRVESVECYMMPAMVDILRAACAGVLDVSISHSSVAHERHMQWAVIRKLTPNV